MPSDEIDDLMSVHAVGKQTDFVTGVRLMVEAALGSPSFMYRRELGSMNAAGQLALSPHELASELSFLLTDSAPDAELAESARSNALADAGEQKRQLDRMLATPAVQDSLVKTLMAAWNMGNLFGTTKDPGLYPEYTPALQASMFHETELFLHDLLWKRNAPIGELLTSRQSFVNPALATLYGVAYPGSTGSAFLQVTLPPERAGLLTQASVLTMLARTDNTSVVARGLFVRGALLCLPKIPGPASMIGSFDGSYADALQLAQAVAMAPEVKACIVRHVMAYGTADDALEANDCQVTGALSSLPDTNPTLTQIVGAVVSSPAFVLRSPESRP